VGVWIRRRLDMNEHAIRELIAEVERGRLSRRRFIRTMVAAGLAPPMAASLLGSAGLAYAQPRASSGAPTRRGGGGQVRMLYWAAPTLLNPHLAVAPKDFDNIVVIPVFVRHRLPSRTGSGDSISARSADRSGGSCTGPGRPDQRSNAANSCDPPSSARLPPAIPTETSHEMSSADRRRRDEQA